MVDLVNLPLIITFEQLLIDSYFSKKNYVTTFVFCLVKLVAEVDFMVAIKRVFGSLVAPKIHVTSNV